VELAADGAWGLQLGNEESRELLARAQAGDRPAFSALYRQHHRRVYALCVRMSGDRALAEDLTQETFVTAWRKLDSFRGEAAFSTWLHRVAVNTVLAHQRRNAGWLRRVVSGVEDLPEPEVHERPDEVRDLESAIAQLPERARQVFVLVDVEGLGHREAAAALGIAEGTSKAQLSRARSLLREMLA
jgi:RNA polymerase sigma-70 factor (ECF subfamily)